MEKEIWKESILMVKRALIILAVIVTVSVMLIDYGINRTPTGEYIRSVESPDMQATINVYIVSPALSNDAIRCEVEKASDGSKRTIYYRYGESEADIIWENNETVVINGITLNINQDSYDWRHDKSY